VALKTASSKHIDGSGDEAPEIVAEINITPLTDVFLVLLIIFMVTTSVINQMGVDVTLPKAQQASSASSSEPEGVIVTLLNDGSIRVNDTQLPPGDLAGLELNLKFWFESHPNSKLVVLEGDQKAFLGSAISVMDAAKRAGAEKFSIATQPE